MKLCPLWRDYCKGADCVCYHPRRTLDRVITIDQVMKWKPCYSREEIIRLARGKEKLTVREIFELRFVSVEDKLWLLLREEIIPARTLHEFALWCAETALSKAKIDDERSWNALRVKRLWLDGKATDEELGAARDAAWDVAWDAARDAAWNAVRDVAWDAARDAAWNAARDAVRDVAREEQLAKLKEMVENG